MILTESDLRCIMPRADVALWRQPLSAAMAAAALLTPKRAAMFLSQIAHESAELTRVEENLNYSAKSLLATWPGRFDPTMARDCAHQPQRIANIAYSGRMGNGDRNSGDGWRYRGRGPIQITGRANYKECGEAMKVDLVAAPELLRLPEYGARSAAWYFTDRMPGISLADAGNLEGCTRRINGDIRACVSARNSFF